VLRRRNDRDYAGRRTADFESPRGPKNQLPAADLSPSDATALRSFKVVQRVSRRDATGVRPHSSTHTSECYHISKRCLEFLSSCRTRICSASARSRPCRSARAPAPSVVRNAVLSDRETCSSKLPFRKPIDQDPLAAINRHKQIPRGGGFGLRGRSRPDSPSGRGNPVVIGAHQFGKRRLIRLNRHRCCSLSALDSHPRQPTTSARLKSLCGVGMMLAGGVGSELPCPLVEVKLTCPGSVKDDRN